jgi:2-oxo-3-hexenedioate decarboxylase
MDRHQHCKSKVAMTAPSHPGADPHAFNLICPEHTMSLEQHIIDDIATHLHGAYKEHREVTKVTDDCPQLDVVAAYQIQDQIRARMLEHGSRLIGMKMGLTSRPKMQQMGVNAPIYGFLMDAFAVEDGGQVDTSTLIHPKVEAEIAFVMKHDLLGPGCDEAAVIAATDFVLPAIEVIDSRYKDFRFDLPSVIADNTSASYFVTGSKATSIEGLDLSTLGVVMEVNGEVVAVGAGAEVLGNPATAVAMLVNMLSEKGESLPAGSVVLSGAITAAFAVKRGDSVLVRTAEAGSVSLTFK